VESAARLLMLGAALAVNLPSCRNAHDRSLSRSWPPVRIGYVNPIPAENALGGDPAWLNGPDAAGHQLEGYADRISARAGDVVHMQVSSDEATTATWTLYRLGWYGGAGARAVRSGGPISVGPQPGCPIEAGTGLVRCAWAAVATIDITSADLSGLYAWKLARHDGKTRFVPFVIVDDRPADLLFQASVQTYAAYNAWGGESLYSDAAKTTPHGYATKVSLDRPFDDDRGTGQLLHWELPMARFLERYGYDVTYATNVDFGTAGIHFLDRAGMFLSVGHDEYWAGEERATVEAARDAGVPLAFFSSNSAYWRIRYEDFRTPGNPRTIACYKAGDDPMGPTASGLFRSRAIGEPENALLGIMSESWQFVPFAFVTGHAAPWLYEGTGLAAGDTVPGLIGHEFDHRYANGFEPSGLTVAARSPVIDTWGKPGWSETVAYRASSGAFVFASGTIFWSRALDLEGMADPRVERMTANVFHEALGLTVPDGLPKAIPMNQGTARFGPVATNVETVARDLPSPAGLAVVPGTAGPLAGNIIVALPRTAQVVQITPGVPTAQVLAGDGYASSSGAYDNVPGIRARFDSPVAVTVDGKSRVFVADSGAHVVRRIDSDTGHTTTTLAGALGVAGAVDGIGGAARFWRPHGLAIDSSGSTLYLADTFNHRIRTIDTRTGVVTTLAGSVAGDVDGPSSIARFNYPTALATASDGRIFVASASSRKIKVIMSDVPRTVITLAAGGEGFADGSGSSVRMSPQAGMAWSGRFLIFSDAPNFRVRALLPSSGTSGSEVVTFAFSGVFGSADGSGASAQVQLPVGVAIGDDGSVYVADAATGAIRAIHILQ